MVEWKKSLKELKGEKNLETSNLEMRFPDDTEVTQEGVVLGRKK